jgi:hypothetical protein
MAEYLLTSARACVKLDPSTRPQDVAALADAGITAYHAVRKALPLLYPGTTAVVIGAGGLGHIGIQCLAALTAARVVVVDRNPDALKLAEQIGAHDTVVADGNHVGANVVDRIYTLFTFAAGRMPQDDRRSAIGGDIADLDGPTGSLEDFAFLETFSSTALGRDVEYGVLLPPDYYYETERRYPVIYFMHGQGDSPSVMLGLNFVLFGPMKESIRSDRQAALESDMQRAIVIFPDGQCHDDCFTGTNYANHDGGGPRFEDAVLELMGVVEGRYRTLAPTFR